MFKVIYLSLKIPGNTQSVLASIIEKTLIDPAVVYTVAKNNIIVFANALSKHNTISRMDVGPPTESPEKYRIFCCLLLCFPHHLEELIMTGTDVLPSLLYKISQNQIAFCAAIEELSLWVEQRGSTQVSDKVRHSLELLHQNAEFISEGIADLKVSY